MRSPAQNKKCTIPGAIDFMRWKAIRVALLMTAPFIPAILCAQSSAFLTITVQDANGAALAGAKIADSSGKLLGSTNADGSLAVDCASPLPLASVRAGIQSPNSFAHHFRDNRSSAPAARAEEEL